jgi:hypothetical protein
MWVLKEPIGCNARRRGHPTWSYRELFVEDEPDSRRFGLAQNQFFKGAREKKCLLCALVSIGYCLTRHECESTSFCIIHRVLFR